ncbi:MAG: T9SS type A sorting domain-containing protein [Bacteroidota bacterium]
MNTRTYIQTQSVFPPSFTRQRPLSSGRFLSLRLFSSTLLLIMLLFSAMTLRAEDFTSNTTVTENVDDGMVIFEGVTVTIAANVFISGGTIDIKPTGTLIVLGSATLSTDQDVVNDNGTITINGAIDTSGSKFENKAGGTVNGSGNLFYSGSTSVENKDSSSFFGYTGGNPTGPDGPCSGGTCSDASLPITLQHFTAKVDTRQVILNWVTASETNNDFFSIERSTDGYSWRTIQELKGAGTSVAERHYSSIDETPYPGLNFYRLRQTDFDGSSTISNISSVEVNVELEEPAVFPNPTKGQVSVSTTANDLSDLRVYSIQGVDVTRQIYMEFSGNRHQLDLTQLPNGLYLLRTPGGITKIYKQ